MGVRCGPTDQDRWEVILSPGDEVDIPFSPDWR